MALRIAVENYRGLARADWTLEPGVSLLVGPNGSGKTTLLDVPALLRDAIERGTKAAVDEHGGPGTLLNLRASGAEHAGIEAVFGDMRWQVELRPRGAELGIKHHISRGRGMFVLSPVTTRELDEFASPVTVRSLDEFASSLGRGDKVDLTLNPASDAASPEMKRVASEGVDLSPLVAPLRHYRLHGGYLTQALRVQGSKSSSDLELDREGSNAFSVLRNWRDARATRPRWDFVVSGLKAAFPEIFEELEFESAGQTVAARVFSPGMSQSIGAYFAPDGLLTGMLHLTAVASVPPGGALSIDEFENSLHPFAIRALLEHVRAWTSANSVSVTLATHSPVLLDQFKEEPSRILVMDSSAEVVPVSVDKLRDPEWLAHFSLGDLYASGEFGSQAAS